MTAEIRKPGRPVGTSNRNLLQSLLHRMALIEASLGVIMVRLEARA